MSVFAAVRNMRQQDLIWKPCLDGRPTAVKLEMRHRFRAKERRLKVRVWNARKSGAPQASAEFRNQMKLVLSITHKSVNTSEGKRAEWRSRRLHSGDESPNCYVNIWAPHPAQETMSKHCFSSNVRASSICLLPLCTLTRCLCCPGRDLQRQDRWMHRVCH